MTTPSASDRAVRPEARCSPLRRARGDLDRWLLTASVALGLAGGAGLLAGRLLGGGLALAVVGTSLVVVVPSLALVGMLSLGLPLGAFAVAVGTDGSAGVDGGLRRDALLAAGVLAGAGVALALLPAGGSLEGGLALALSSVAAAVFVGAVRTDRSAAGGPPASWVGWAVALAALLGAAARPGSSGEAESGGTDPGGLAVAMVLLLGVPVAAGAVAWRLRSVRRSDEASAAAEADDAAVAALGARIEGAVALAAGGGWDEALALLAAEPEPPWWGRDAMADALARVAVEQRAPGRLDALLSHVPGATAVDGAYALGDDDLAVRAMAAALARGGVDAALIRQRVGAHDWRRLHRLDAFRALATEHGLERDPVYGP